MRDSILSLRRQEVFPSDRQYSSRLGEPDGRCSCEYNDVIFRLVQCRTVLLSGQVGAAFKLHVASFS